MILPGFPFQRPINIFYAINIPCGGIYFDIFPVFEAKITGTNGATFINKARGNAPGELI